MMKEELREWTDWAIARRGLYKDSLVLRVPRQVKQKLEEEAKNRGLTVSDLVRLAILKWFEDLEQEKSYGKR